MVKEDQVKTGFSLNGDVEEAGGSHLASNPYHSLPERQACHHCQVTCMRATSIRW